MKRTITMKSGRVYYHGQKIDYMFHAIRDHFKLIDSNTYKYIVTIVESMTGRYQFRNGHCPDMYDLYKIGKKRDFLIESICKSKFKRVFFKPWVRKRYNITVKKVKIKSEKK